MRAEKFKTPTPCQKNCPDRATTCHASCQRYLEWEKARNAYYDSAEYKGASQLTTDLCGISNRRYHYWLKSKRSGQKGKANSK